jgi:4-hydroxybenzoate polyprenyltransferase
VDQSAPAWARPYLRLTRLDRPIGWWLLLLPCWWSTALAADAARAWPNPLTLLLFLIGAIVGCYNIWMTIRGVTEERALADDRPEAAPAGRPSLQPGE